MKYTDSMELVSKFFLVFTSYKYLLFQITQREIKSRYKQSFLGYAWVLLSPLLQLLVYSFVFSEIFRFPTNGIPYSIFLFVGLLPWIYLQTSISQATMALVASSDLLRKVYFPREVFIYSIIIAKGLDFIFASVVLVIFILFYHIPISASALMIIPLLLIQILLMTGLSLLLSALNLFYRDIQYLVTLILMLWMYLSPVVYALSLVPNKYLFWYKLNPMVGIIEGYRSALFNSTFDTGTIALSLISSSIIFIFGFIIFKKSEKLFADIV